MMGLPNKMSIEEYQLKVDNIPQGKGVTTNFLKFFFQNRRNGGGPVEEINLDEQTNSAIVTFKDKSSVTTLLDKGEQVTIKDTLCAVSAVCKRKSDKDEQGFVVKRQSADTETVNLDLPQRRVGSNATKSTLQIEIHDVFLSRDCYILLFEAEPLNKAPIFLNEMFIDGLKKTIFVPFYDEPGVLEMCKKNLENNTNIKSCKMVDYDVYDHYPDMLSVHGLDFNDHEMQKKLKQFVKERTGIFPHDIQLGEEPCSAVLQFDIKGTDIYTIGWQCIESGQDDIQLVTSPVRRCRTILASVSDSGKDVEDFIEKYFKNKDKSNGGPIETFIPINNLEYKITFKDITDVSSVLAKKDHKIGLIKIFVKNCYHCLSKEAYPDYMKSQRMEMLEWYKFEILKRCNFINDQEKRSVKIELCTASKHSTIELKFKGSEGSVEAAIKSLKMLLLNFEAEKLNIGNEEKKQFILQESLVVEKLNETLEENAKEAIVFIEKQSIWCFKRKSEESIEYFINQIVHADKMKFEMLNLKSKTIFSKFKKCEDICYRIIFDNDNKELQIFTIESKPKSKCNYEKLRHELDQFLDTYYMEPKILPFPKLKIEFANKYLDLPKEVELSFDDAKGEMRINGLKSSVKEVEKKLSDTTIQDVTLTKFSIFEFLNSEKGTKILKNVENNYQVLLRHLDTSHTDFTQVQTSTDGNASTNTVVATADVNGLKIKFVHGDLTSLKVQVIVNPIDDSLQCKKGINKAIIEKGGREIASALQSYDGDNDVGCFFKTTGGNLDCSYIYHLILERKMNANCLLNFVADLLLQVDQSGFKSVALPLLGCGRFKVSPVGASLNIYKAIDNFATSQKKNLEEVNICDMEPKHLKPLMDRFGDNINIFQPLDALLDKEEDEDEDVIATASSSNQSQVSSDGSTSKQFGNLTCTLKEGNILEEQCDVIAAGLKKDMNLQKAGAVSKAMLIKCGSSLQAECESKDQEFKLNGVVDTAAYGLSCSAIFFVNMEKYAHHWDQGVTDILTKAEEGNFSSIALPAFGTGGKNPNIPKLKKSILSAIKMFGLKSNPKFLKDVKLVIFDKKLLKEFQRKDSAGHRRNDVAHRSLQRVSQMTKVQVVFKDAKIGNNAIKDLKAECEKKFKRFTINDDVFKNMENKEIQALQKEGLHKLVHVDIQKQEGIATLCSFYKSEINNLKDSIMDQKNKKLFASIQNVICWRYLSHNGNWKNLNASNEIEIAYKKKEKDYVFTDAKGRQFRIDFQTMKEYNSKGKECGKVDRQDLREVEAILPEYWEPMSQGENVKEVNLLNTSDEYKRIENFFHAQGAKVPVKRIDRIQNVTLYKQYAAKKEYLEKSNPQGTQNERQLFHGTHSDSIANINHSGFNRSYCGKNGVAYGDGVYFAEESSYSVGYAKADGQGNRKMYVAKVLVGVTIQSQSGMKYLPNKPGTNVPYDSGHSGKIFVIFHDSHAYPEYIITF